MENRTLTITVSPDWRSALKAAGRLAGAEHYQGETLNFESPGGFLGRLTARRWGLVETLFGAGEVPVRELARRVGRDVKRVHEDVAVLAELGLVERSARGGVLCPFVDIHVDLHIRETARVA